MGTGSTKSPLVVSRYTFMYSRYWPDRRRDFRGTKSCCSTGTTSHKKPDFQGNTILSWMPCVDFFFLQTISLRLDLPLYSYSFSAAPLSSRVTKVNNIFFAFFKTTNVLFHFSLHTATHCGFLSAGRTNDSGVAQLSDNTDPIAALDHNS